MMILLLFKAFPKKAGSSFVTSVFKARSMFFTHRHFVRCKFYPSEALPRPQGNGPPGHPFGPQLRPSKGGTLFGPYYLVVSIKRLSSL